MKTTVKIFSAVLLKLLAVAACLLSADAALAQIDAAGDSFTFYAVGQPQGPVQAAYLRMHHPLYLLDLCRKVQAGQVDLQSVESLVGRNTLNALLGMDLNALYQSLTGPHDAASAPTHSLWYQILTNGGTAPLPPPDLPDRLTIPVNAGGAQPQVLRVTSLSDGFLSAQLPSDSPFQILSMRTYDGVILQQPPSPNRPANTPTDAFGSAQMSRIQPPWTVPVVAGQDVDVEIGLPTGAAVPPGGLSSTILVGDAFQNLWQQNVSLVAQPPLSGGDIILVYKLSRTHFDVVTPVVTPSNFVQTFTVPITVGPPFPAVLVAGTFKPLSLPPGVSMPPVNFFLAPQSTASLALPISIDSSSQTYQNHNVPQSFSIQVSYHTISPPFAARTDTLTFSFTTYPSSQDWLAQGSTGGVNCEIDVLLFSDGTMVRNGDCDNRNFFNANIDARGKLGGLNVVQFFFGLGFFDQKFASFTDTELLFQTNYPFLYNQPLLMSWTKI